MILAISPHSRMMLCAVMTVVVVCRGKGMPISKAPGTFGNLRVKLEVEYPTTLSEAQRATLRDVL